jgi:hypothetical protein
VLPLAPAAVPRQENALTDRENEKTRSDQIIPFPEEFQAEQTRRHHEAGTIDRPEDLL